MECNKLLQYVTEWRCPIQEILQKVETVELNEMIYKLI